MAEQRTIPNKQVPPLYAAADFYLLRAPALSARVFTQVSSAGHVSWDAAQDNLDEILQKQQDNCSQVLQELATHPQIAQALAVASSSLWQAVQRLQSGACSPAQGRRTLASLLRYLIRMSTRPTPFGLFSGVACGTFADETQAYLASPALARFRTRPDMQWLYDLLQTIEADRALVRQLSVRSNPMVYLSGEWAVLPFDNTYGTEKSHAVYLRAISLVRATLDLAQQFIPYTQLQRTLQELFPTVTLEQVERVLWHLWEKHFLMSQLHPPATDARPAEYVLKQLHTLSGANEFKEQVTRVLERASAFDQSGVSTASSAIPPLVAEIGTTETDRFQFQVDSALHLKAPMLHYSVGQAAVRAAEFLLRQTPFPQGPRHLHEYRMLFMERYGPQAEIPLLDLLSAENGLDAPPGYEHPPRVSQHLPRIQPPTSGPRDQLLLSLVTEAVNKRSLEVELTEELQQSLERWSPKMQDAPSSLEIYLQLHASSREAVDCGAWTAVLGVNCGSLNAGRAFGRFFDLLGEASVERLRNLARHEEALLPDVIFAELSYQPLDARMANVAIHPLLHSYEIALGPTPSVPPAHLLLLNDLVVGIQHGRFYLRSLRLGKQIRVRLNHKLNIRFAPNICRFIAEIARDGQPFLNPFDWGASVDAPFHPRLVIKTGISSHLVISPAHWKLRATAIMPTGKGSVETRWFRGLQQWRAQWRVPRYVYLSALDNCLLLDLENPLMTAELYNELHKQGNQGQIDLNEVLPDFEHLWLHDEQGAGYFSEIVVPLLRTDAVEPPISLENCDKPLTAPRQVVAPVERNRFPGEEWVFLKLYTALSQHERLLAGPLRELAQTLQKRELIDRWFFIRYADPEPHLRLRLHASEAINVQSLLAIALPWCVQLARHGKLQRYTLDTYEREVERYGGPDAIDLMEQVFSLDSEWVSDIFALRYSHRLKLDPLAVAVFTLDHFFRLWGYDLQKRLAWVQQKSEKYACSKEFHAERKRYCDLLVPNSQRDPDLAAQRALLIEAFRAQEVLLRQASTHVRQLVKEQKLWVSESSLLASLGHMHLNRLLGIERTKEMRAYAFWRHTLDSLSRLARQADGALLLD